MKSSRRFRCTGLLGLLGIAIALPACELLCFIFLLFAYLGGIQHANWFEYFFYQASANSIPGGAGVAGGSSLDGGLEVLGKKDYGEFAFSSEIAHEGTFDVCLTVGAVNLPAHLPFSSRALLRVAPEGTHPNGTAGFGIRATSGGVESVWTIDAISEGEPPPGANSVFIAGFETLVLRIEQTASARTFLAATESAAAQQQWTQVHQMAVAPPVGRHVFGGAARGLGKKAGFLFESLRVGGVQYGGEGETAVITELGGALDLLRAAMTSLEFGAEGASGAESKLDEALAALDDAAVALESATLMPEAEGALAAKALKRASSKTKIAKKKTDKVVKKGKGSTKKARKKTKAALARATVAIGNLLGVKTKKASASLADAIVVGTDA